MSYPKLTPVHQALAVLLEHTVSTDQTEKVPLSQALSRVLVTSFIALHIC